MREPLWRAQDSEFARGPGDADDELDDLSEHGWDGAVEGNPAELSVGKVAVKDVGWESDLEDYAHERLPAACVSWPERVPR